MDNTGLLDKLSLLFRVKKNQIWMVMDRGYKLPEKERLLLKGLELMDMGYDPDMNISGMTGDKEGYLSYLLQEKMPQVKQTIKNANDYRQALSQAYEAPDGRTLLVKYTPGGEDLVAGYQHVLTSKKRSQLPVKVVDIFINEFDRGRYDEGMLISDLPFSSDAQNRLNNVAPKKNNTRLIWTFEDRELYINPNKHQVAVPHTLVPALKRGPLLQGLGATEEQLPRIDITDPICKWYGWSSDSLIKIERNHIYVDNMIAPNTYFWRHIKK